MSAKYDAAAFAEWNAANRRAMEEYLRHPLTIKDQEGEAEVPKKDKPTYEMLELQVKGLCCDLREANAENAKMRLQLMRLGARGPERKTPYYEELGGRFHRTMREMP